MQSNGQCESITAQRSIMNLLLRGHANGVHRPPYRIREDGTPNQYFLDVLASIHADVPLCILLDVLASFYTEVPLCILTCAHC